MSVRSQPIGRVREDVHCQAVGLDAPAVEALGAAAVGVQDDTGVEEQDAAAALDETQEQDVAAASGETQEQDAPGESFCSVLWSEAWLG